MTADPDRLTKAERRSAIFGPLYRILGTPVVALLGLANTAIIVRETGAAVFGLVALVATITLLFPFADLGIGATAMTAGAQLSGPLQDPHAADVIRRSFSPTSYAFTFTGGQLNVGIFGQFLAMDLTCAGGEILPAEESLLIATARVNGFSLVTHRAAHHKRLGVNVIDPWARAAL